MGEALLWGLVGGGALVLGALVGLLADVPSRVIGLITAFGAGVLISAVAFELTDEAYRQGGALVIFAGLAAGALAFFAGDAVVAAHDRKRSRGSGGSSASALALGAVLDGIPESAVIGASLIGGGAVGAPVVVAVFISNVPESLAAATGMRRDGRSRAFVLGLWTTVMLISGAASALGYVLLADAPEELLAGCQAFAAGAILTMLADTMMPEAVEEGGRRAGLFTVLGFAVAFLLSKLE